MGCHALFQGYLPHPGTKHRSLTLQANSLPSEPPGKAGSRITRTDAGEGTENPESSKVIHSSQVTSKKQSQDINSDPLTSEVIHFHKNKTQYFFSHLICLTLY